jgi:sodium ion-translocating decarboxylase beta subunit
MIDSIVAGLSGLSAGVVYLFSAGLPNVIMLAVGCTLLYLGAKKDVEPLLLIPIGIGCVLVNIPLSELGDEGGLLRIFYQMGVANELFPLLIFVAIGAMTDFGPLLENPRILLFGAAGQFGIFLVLMLALALGFPVLEAVSIAIIGACDGPTAIYVTSQYAPHLLGPVSVAAYSYMALVPIIMPPIMRALTTEKERTIKMVTVKRSVSPTTKLLFPIVVTLVGGLIAPKGLPLLGTIMLGNFMRESGAVARLTKASENEIANVVTLFLGLAIGGTMEGHAFLTPTTLAIFGMGFLAYPMAARVVQTEGLRYNKKSHLLMHAAGANTGGQIGSVIAAAVMLSVLKGMGLI